MDQDRMAGTVRQMGGKVQEGVGKVAGSAETEAEGLANQVAGAAQNLYGQVKDTTAGAVKVVQDSAGDAGDYIRTVVEERPFTVALVALAVGFAVGFTVRHESMR